MRGAAPGRACALRAPTIRQGVRGEEVRTRGSAAVAASQWRAQYLAAAPVFTHSPPRSLPSIPCLLLLLPPSSAPTHNGAGTGHVGRASASQQCQERRGREGGLLEKKGGGEGGKTARKGVERKESVLARKVLKSRLPLPPFYCREKNSANASMQTLQFN